MTEIENWRELPGAFVEFTVKRLRDNDKEELAESRSTSKLLWMNLNALGYWSAG
jgi:hypothetical protein